MSALIHSPSGRIPPILSRTSIRTHGELDRDTCKVPFVASRLQWEGGHIAPGTHLGIHCSKSLQSAASGTASHCNFTEHHPQHARFDYEWLAKSASPLAICDVPRRCLHLLRFTRQCCGVYCLLALDLVLIQASFLRNVLVCFLSICWWRHEIGIGWQGWKDSSLIDVPQ